MFQFSVKAKRIVFVKDLEWSWLAQGKNKMAVVAKRRVSILNRLFRFRVK